MTTKALNFTTDCLDFFKTIEKMNPMGNFNMAQYQMFVKMFSYILTHGEKFCIFDNEIIEEPITELKCLQNLRFPFPITILEYKIDDSKDVTENARATNRITAIVESSKVKDIPGLSLFIDNDPNKFYIFSACQSDANKSWMTVPMIATVNINQESLAVGAGRCVPIGTVIPPELWEQTASEFHIDGRIAINFASLYACSNVEVVRRFDIIDKLNKKRLKNGKTPYFSAYTLTLDLRNRKVYEKKDNENPSKKASPRKHTRRGHVRHLENKNVFVSACVVSADRDDSIDKVYLI